MFTIPHQLCERVHKTLPELLKSSCDWKGFRHSNGHLITESLIYNFGKYNIVLSCKYSKEHEDWSNVRHGWGPSYFMNVLRGEIEVVLGEFNRKRVNKRLRLTHLATIFLGEGGQSFFSNRHCVLIIPRSTIV